jgi:hypothetical protein
MNPPPMPPELSGMPPVPPVMPSHAPEPPVWQTEPPPPSSGGKWVLYGCGGCLSLVAILAVVGWIGFSKLMSTVKASPVYKAALAEVQRSPEVVAEIGEPISEGFMSIGKTSKDVSGESGEYTFMVKGPKGEALAMVLGESGAGGVVTLSRLTVTVAATKKMIELVAPAGAEAAGEEKALPGETKALPGAD